MNQPGHVRRERPQDRALEDALARAQEGDEAAFATVYRMVHPGVLGYVRGLVGDDAEDVAAEAWLEITRDLWRFRGDAGGFRGWTATIARHRALDHLRRQRVRPRSSFLDPAVLELPGGQNTQEQAIESITTRQALNLIAGLPQDQAEAVLLRVVVGLTGPAAARVLGKRPGAVRSAAHRGLKRLARQLTGTGVPESGPHTLGKPI
ncbi:RNA polymerase sigma factor [Streptomyces sp. TS71-3]|uniref:RNA polymerase sigma factor n=1 Tax=Streptomyces sp. TS71-3 TaxID=2733862 RepID=UPI001B0C6009|nr:RNA polymerase sigma factor [Streptomyces sp. TS71-3]GHJ35946.1 RNA polymerase sigma24 factor [Streptomyces sp. TS71-3]